MLGKQVKINNRIKKAIKTRKMNRETESNRTYQNREWLFSRYCIDRISIIKITEFCKVEYDVIWDSLKKVGIPTMMMVGKEEWYDWVEKNEKKIQYRGI